MAVASLLFFVALAMAPALRSSAQSPPPTYTFIDLGVNTLGGTHSKAFGINNCGLVVGESTLVGASPANPTHPFVWRDVNGNGIADAGEMKDLGTLGGASGSAAGINATGLVCGISRTASGEDHAFRWQDTNGNGVSDPGELNDLGLLPGHVIAIGLGVNDINQISGQSETEFLEARAFIWSQNQNPNMQIVPTLNGITPSYGYGINNSSHIAGYATNNRAYVFNGVTNIDLGTLGGSQSIAYDINDASHAVGKSQLDNSSASPPTHAFKWRDQNGNGLTDSGEMQTLGTLTGGVRSSAFGINSAGVVVGYSEVTGGASHAFVHDGTMRDLNTAGVVTNLPAGWVLEQAEDINDSGQIVGYGKNSGGETRAFLLTPTIFTSTCTPTVTVTVSPSSVAEDGSTNLTYTFTRAPVTSNSLTVNFAIDPSSTADGSDFGISSSGSVTIPANSASATVVVDPTLDSTVEPNETVVLTVAPGTGYSAGSPSSATATITNDDAAPPGSIQFSSSTYNVDEGAGTASIAITRTGGSNGAVSVSFSTTSGGTATAGDDYTTVTNQTVNFGNGDTTSKTVTVPIHNDGIDEAGETVNLAITGATGGATLGTPNTAVLTIDDNDAAPTIQITSVTAPEPSSGSTSIVFTVSLNNHSSSQITVNYATTATGATTPATGGSGCAAGIDFVNASGTLTFLPNETSKQVSVTVCGDNDLEPDETFFVTLSGNTNSTLPPNTQGTGTITPQAPIVWTEAAGPSCPSGTCAAAVDSVTFVRGPFRLVNDRNFSSDHLTRVILITSHLGMTNADLATGILSVRIAGYANPLPIENVGTLTIAVNPAFNVSYIIVKLPADLSSLNPSPGPNNLTLTVKMGSAESNATILSIAP